MAIARGEEEMDSILCCYYDEAKVLRPNGVSEGVERTEG
jgi:hypothetical protein